MGSPAKLDIKLVYKNAKNLAENFFGINVGNHLQNHP